MNNSTYKLIKQTERINKIISPNINRIYFSNIAINNKINIINNSFSKIQSSLQQATDVLYTEMEKLKSPLIELQNRLNYISDMLRSTFSETIQQYSRALSQINVKSNIEISRDIKDHMFKYVDFTKSLEEDTYVEEKIINDTLGYLECDVNSIVENIEDDVESEKLLLEIKSNFKTVDKKSYKEKVEFIIFIITFLMEFITFILNISKMTSDDKIINNYQINNNYEININYDKRK